jgi:hypothetical protein
MMVKLEKIKQQKYDWMMKLKAKKTSTTPRKKKEYWNEKQNLWETAIE